MSEIFLYSHYFFLAYSISVYLSGRELEIAASSCPKWSTLKLKNSITSLAFYLFFPLSLALPPPLSHSHGARIEHYIEAAVE